MNERIFELVKQSGFDTRREAVIVDGLDITRTVENLTQLIIAECAGICYNRDFADGSDYGDAIQTHFGLDK
jgi:hypothetical protein